MLDSIFVEFTLLVLPYSYPPIILMFVYFCDLYQVYVTTLNWSWWGSSDEGHHIILIDRQ